MLTESGLLEALRNLMPTGNVQEGGNHDDDLYCLCGDPAYPQLPHIFGGFQNPPPGSQEALMNTVMSSVCESVEWGFAHINRQWAFPNYFPGLKLFQLPIANCQILHNCNIPLQFEDMFLRKSDNKVFLLQKRQFHN